MKQTLFLFLCTMFFTAVDAQEYLGIVNSNYAGVMGVGLNPSSFVDSKLKFDVNIGTGGASLDNTFLYIPKSDLTFFGFGNIVNIVKDKGYLTRYDPNNPNDPQSFTLAGEGTGPSFMLNFAKRHSLGFTIAGKFFMTSDDVPGHVAENIYQELRDESLWGIDWQSENIKYNVIGWAEYGITYGVIIYENKLHELKGGLSLKLLDGFGGAYIKNGAVNYNIENDQLITFGPTLVDYGRTNYNSYEHANSYHDVLRGGGFGWDLGFTYEWKRDSTQWTYEMDQQKWADPDANKYRLRIGASLIDMGSINFDKSTQTFHLQGDTSYYPEWRGEHFESNIDFDTTMSNIFYGNPTESFVADNFKMTLPGAFSLQVDWNIYKNWFVNATIIQGFNHSKSQGITRPDIYSLTPRYEYKWVEVSLPLSIEYYGHTKARIGLALRAGPVFVGSDEIGSLLGLNDLEGADFYAGLRVYIPQHRLKDVDHDKVSDEKDRCPLVPGSVKLQGCPDRDGDGIEDSQDDCPDVPGVAALKGCPDKDGDGITDLKDKCPDEAGLPQFDGCPDRDNDGIPDFEDECPDIAGTLQFHGCPDTDGDGIPDLIDSCANDPGPVSTNGCPDKDGDLVPDYKDRCPDVPGLIENHGCPVIKEEAINKIKLSAKSINFETGSANIKGASFQVLDVIAEIMQQYSYTKWSIEGYTDNVGSDAINLALSKKRAAAVRDYFISKGVSPDRLTSEGYGKINPVAPNTTKDGRATNRRVEIKLTN